MDTVRSVAMEQIHVAYSLGAMIMSASEFLQTAVVVMGIVVIGIIAYCFDLFMRWVEKVVVPWKGRV